MAATLIHSAAWGKDTVKVEPKSPWGGMAGGRNADVKAYRMGTRFTRADICWFRIEYGQDRWSWAFQDKPITNRYNAGIISIPILYFGPTWDRAYFQHGVANYDDFGDYVYHAVERYDADGVDDAPGSPRINIWEIWNEPGQGSPYWSGSNEDYYRLLKLSYRYVKAADPTAKVLSGTDIPVHAPHYGDYAEYLSHHMYRTRDWANDMGTFIRQVRGSENKMNAAGVFGKLHTNLEWNHALFNRPWGAERWGDYDLRESIMCLAAGIVLTNGPQCMGGMMTGNVLGVPAKLGLENSIDKLRIPNTDQIIYVVRRADGTAAAVAWENGPWEGNPISTLTLDVGQKAVDVVGQYGFEKKYKCPKNILTVKLTRSPTFLRKFVDNIKPTMKHDTIASATAGTFVKVAASVTDVSPTSATLYWRAKGKRNYESKPMVRTGTKRATDSFDGYIPVGAVKAAGVEYYVEGSDTWGNKVYAPKSGARKPTVVSVAKGDAKKANSPEISHAVPAKRKAGFYVQLKATIKDDIGVETATVYYRSGSRGKFTALPMDVYAPQNAYFARIPAEAVTGKGVEYYIEATDREGSGASFSPREASDKVHKIKVTVDKKAPATPKQVVAKTVADYVYVWTTKDRHRAVKVSWAKSNADDLDGYNIYRSQKRRGPYTKLNHVPLISTYHVSARHSTSPPPLLLGKAYYWVVTAVDTSGNESKRSKPVVGALGSLDDKTAPPVPQNLRIDEVADKEIGADLTINTIWDGVQADDLDHYRLYRATKSGGPYERVNVGDGRYDDSTPYPAQATKRTGGRWSRMATIYHDRDVKDKVAYYYVVKAVDHSGNESAKSDELKVTAIDDPTKIRAHVVFASGSDVEVFVRGKPVGRGGWPAACWGWDTPSEFWTTFDMDKKNLVAVWGVAYLGTPMFYFNAIFDNGAAIVSDGSWSIVAKGGREGGSGGDWAEKVDFDDSAWATPMELGRWWEFLTTMDILPQTQGIQAKSDLKTAHKSFLARKVFTPTAK
ncbi:MAG: hypothetical protein QF662_00520, partial [Phycisphaerae bacterium]|nr:hypothetical protein [Phycisphaerae bacterium]